MIKYAVRDTSLRQPAALLKLEMEIIFGILAGLFLGTTMMLAYVVRFLSNQIRKVDAERMRAINKSYVRDGQARLFPDAVIAATEDVEADETPTRRPVAIKSPFNTGLTKKRTELEQQKKAVNIPPEIAQRIAHEAEEKRRAAAA